MYKVHIDFETRSIVDLTKVGTWNYASHPSTQILCCVFKYCDKTVLLTPDNIFNEELNKLAKDDTVVFVAHNAFFEQAIWNNIMFNHGYSKIDETKWRCTLAKAAAHSLPRSLEKVGEVLNVEHKKDMTGKTAMMALSKPRRLSKENTDLFWEKDKAPERFKQLYEYCKTDVVCEEEIDKALYDLSEKEQLIWFLDQKINQRGIRVDLKKVKKAIKFLETLDKEAIKELRDITGQEDIKITHVQRLREFIFSRCPDLDVPDLAKNTVAKLLQLDLPTDVKNVLYLRRDFGKTSVAKYDSLLNATCDDGRLRDTLMYHGASTGRWSGKLVQLQNIPRGNIEDTDKCIEDFDLPLSEFKKKYTKPVDAISSCIRGMFIPSEGKKLIVADYSAIEARVLVWLARDKNAIKRFEENVDSYKDMASVIYKKPVSEITKDERQLGKQAVLGCGYGMGKDKFKITCEGYGMDVDLALAEKAVKAYREKYRLVRSFWYDLENAAIEAVLSDSGKIVTVGDISFVKKNDFLFCKLPSGRSLSYYQPQIIPKTTPWGTDTEALTYMSVNSFTKKWERQETYGGKLVENVTQAVARDLMAEAMYRVEKTDFDVLLSVHDELITEVDIGRKNSVKDLENLMCRLPIWAMNPAGKIPINAEGWEGERYKK